MRVAITTFAVLKAPYGNAEVQEFDDRTPDVFVEAEQADGFIERAKEIDDKTESCNFNRDWGMWGEFSVPDFYQYGRDDSTDQRASTISLWRDLESLKKFVFSGLHLEALKKRYQWFEKISYPNYAVWWIEDNHIPTWSEAVSRLDHLNKMGPTPYAFDFRCPYGSSGEKLS